MKVEEPMIAYNVSPSADVLRSRIVSRLEHEEDTHVLQLVYTFMERLQGDDASDSVTPKYTLDSLQGIFKDAIPDDKSYDELKMEYFKNKYGL